MRAVTLSTVSSTLAFVEGMVRQNSVQIACVCRWPVRLTRRLAAEKHACSIGGIQTSSLLSKI